MEFESTHADRLPPPTGIGDLETRHPTFSLSIVSVTLTVNSYGGLWVYKPQSLGGSLSATPLRPRQLSVNMSRGKTDTLPLHLQCACHPFIESSDTQFWTSLCTMDVTSDECLSKVQTLLTCPFMIALVRSFRGNQAQMLVDFLHHVSRLCASYSDHSKPWSQVLSCSRLDKKLWQRCLRLLSKICNAQAIIPASYILQHEVTYVGSFHEHGGFAEVSNGQYLGRPVAIKNLKMNKGDPDKMFKVPLVYLGCCHCPTSISNQRFCREVVRWKHLSHPNILPLLGVSVSTDPPRFRIFSEWMPNRNVIKYATSNPEANRLRLVSPTPISL